MRPLTLTCITASQLLRRIVQTDDFDRLTVLGSHHVRCLGEIFGSADFPLHLQIKKGHGDAATRERERAATIELAVS